MKTLNYHVFFVKLGLIRLKDVLKIFQYFASTPYIYIYIYRQTDRDGYTDEQRQEEKMRVRNS